MIKLKSCKYQIKKIGNNDKPEAANQDEWFDFSGRIFNSSVKLDLPVCLFIGDKEDRFHGGYWFRTSKIRSMYQHGSNQDKLVLPKDFPISKDLTIPDLKEDDILLATMNSIYLMREVDES